MNDRPIANEPKDGFTEAQRQHYIETYKALFVIGPAAVKTLMTLNGGAALALLAFVGHLIGRDKPAGAVVDNVSSAFIAFLIGTALCGLVMIAGYVSQLALFNETKFPHVKRRYWQSHALGIHASIVGAAAALGCFIVGSWTAVCGLARMP